MNKSMPKKKQEKLIKNKIANALHYYRNTKEDPEKVIEETVNNLYCLFTSIDTFTAYLQEVMSEERIIIILRKYFGKCYKAESGFVLASRAIIKEILK